MPLTPTAHADMPSYRWPGYEMHLLGELQRQQYSSQYCDTLLQTEGISVPTHSCVLAALSPYLSHRLSATPPPPMGQKRQLHLQAMKAQTLLKLVGLLYSGELEVKGLGERNDVLAAAHQFGIAKLVEGHSDFRTRGEDVQNWRRNFCRSRVGQRRLNVQDAQVQAEMAATGGESTLAIMKSCVSTGTQTVEGSEGFMNPGGSFLCDQVEHLLPVPLAIAAQILDVSIVSQPPNLTVDQNFPPLTCHPVPLDGVTTCGQSSDVVINPTSTSIPSRGLMTLPPSVHDDLSSAREDDVPRESSECADGIQAFVSEEARPEDGGTKGGTMDARKDEVCGDKTEACAEKRPACVAAGVKSVANMRQMMETTHISIKVKLRRRTKGEVWEVVSMQNGDETLSLHTSLKQDLSRHTLPQKDHKEVHPPFPTAHLESFGKPESWCLHTANTNSSERLDPTLSDSDSQPPSTSCCDENRISGLNPEPPGCGEESDEQIERLLEDIMMGLNILPGFERGCKKSQQNDAGIQFGFAAPNESGCTRPSTAQNHVQIQQSDPTSGHNTSTSESQNSLYLGERAASSAMTMDFFSSGQKAEHTTLQQEGERILELLPLSNALHVEGSLSLPFMDELRLPQCLSPLDPCLPPVKRQRLANNSTNTESQPTFLRQRPWLSEKPQSLQFPFSADNEGESEDTRPCTVKCVKERRVKTNPKRTESSNFEDNDTKVDSAAPKRRKTACKKLPQDANCSFSAGRESKVKDETKTVCPVNLLSKKVTVRERKTATSSSVTSGNLSVTKKHVGAVERSRIRTRDFVRRVGEDAKDTMRETTVLTPAVRRKKVVNKWDPSLPKRGPGRPRKASRQTSSCDSVPSVIMDASCDVGSDEVKVESLPNEEQNGTMEREYKKRRRSISEVEGVPLKKTASAQRTNEVLPSDPTHLKSLKKHRTVNLMEFKKLIKQQHSKTRKSREGPKSKGPVGDGGSEVRDGSEDGTKDESAPEELDMQGKEKPNLDDEGVRVEDDLWPSSQSEARSRSTDEETSVSNGGHPESSSGGCQEGLHCNVTEEEQTASGHHSWLQTAAGTAPPSSSADGLIRTSSHLREEEEDVDVVLCSPAKDSPVRKCEDGLNSVDVTPDEEEEEEIDVTGDEAE